MSRKKDPCKNTTVPVQKNPDGNAAEICHCTSFCPKCGADVYYTPEGECRCTNKACKWSCESACS